MKKFFTLCAVAMAAASMNAQTPLELGGGWNEGFAGEAETYTFQVNSQWGAAEFSCGVSSAEYTKAILEFDGALPANFQVNYSYKAAADATGEPSYAYGVVAAAGQEQAEVVFNPEHPYIVAVSVQKTDAVETTLKIKKMTLVSEAGEKKVTPVFTSWAGSDVTVYTSGTVHFKGQYNQLVVKGLTGVTGPKNVKVVLAEAYTGVQICIDYKDGTHDYPQFNGAEAEVTLKDGAEVENFGIQHTNAEEMYVTVVGAYDMTSTGVDAVSADKNREMYNILGQRVSDAKGLVIINGKKTVIR